MCYNPIKIPNVNYGKGHIGLLFTKDTVHRFMEVPCGHCDQCVAARQADLVQRATVEARNHHLFFATLTYDNEHLPHAILKAPPSKEAERLVQTQYVSTLFDITDPDSELPDRIDPSVPTIDEVEEWLSNYGFDGDRVVSIDKDHFTDLDTGEVILKNDIDKSDWIDIDMQYADIHDVQLLLKNLRDNLMHHERFEGRDLKYIAVSELGKMNGRPHFHILFFVEHRAEDFVRPGIVDRSVMRTLEKVMWSHVFRYWAHNVGTRKNPVYEPLFKYRKRFFGNKVHTNFDLHWVDPSTSKDGVKNVAFYVTKYILKASDKERRRQQFLRLNLSQEDYYDFWQTVKCKCTISKGLGLDARFYTEERKELIDLEGESVLSQYAKYLQTCEDLPVEFEEFKLLFLPRMVRKTRIMVPNFDIANEIRNNCAIDAGKSKGPVFIDDNGNHVPLSHYYQRFGYIYTQNDYLTIWFSWNPDNEVNYRDMSPEWKDKRDKSLACKRMLSEMNSTFDTSAALLDGDYNKHHLVLG